MFTSRLSCALLLIATLASPAVAQPQPTAGPLVELRGGAWFDGTRFVRGSRFMRDGVFVSRGPQRPDSVVDLSGRWIVPPYGDAHTHSPDGRYGFEAIRDMYLRLGVFYVQTLANSRAGHREIAALVNIPRSVDVVFADAAITGTGGHPQVLYESLGLFRRFWQTTAEQQQAARSVARDRDVYERLDSLPQLEAIVRRMARDSATILKVMLLDSESWERRHTDSTQVGNFGVNPALLAPLVRAAHQQGRRVWAHVETPYDLAIALRDGVDAFAHVPGYGSATHADSDLAALRIPDSTVRRAGARGVLMTATLGLGAAEAGTDTARLRRFREVAVRNARALHRAGVRLLAGSDTYSDADLVRRDPLLTAEALGLSPAARLRLLAEDTPRAIFPGRRIGALQPGYEASALVLSCHPLRDARCLHAITARLKQGEWLTVPPAP